MFCLALQYQLPTSQIISKQFSLHSTATGLGVPAA